MERKSLVSLRFETTIQNPTQTATMALLVDTWLAQTPGGAWQLYQGEHVSSERWLCMRGMFQINRDVFSFVFWLLGLVFGEGE